MLHSIPPYPRAAAGTMQLSGNWDYTTRGKIDSSARFFEGYDDAILLNLSDYGERICLPRSLLQKLRQ
jgi:hypothetical protein